jgi:HD superfamily phosphohydrolase
MNKLIKDIVHGYVSFDEQLINIINSPEFQRLKNVRQTSYTSLYPSSSHDRFTHSLGVYRLGKYAFENLRKNVIDDYKNDLPETFWSTQENIFLLACLLHDVGHSPFSHTGEYFYLRKRSSDGNCYIYTELSNIVNNSEFSAQFKESVKAKKVAKPHEIMSAIIGIKNWLSDYEPEHKELFARMIIGLPYEDMSTLAYGVSNALIYLLNSSVIDVDKLDYLLRDKMMTGFEGVNIDTERLLASVCLVNKKIRGANPEYRLGYYKNALSVIENVVIAHDAEKKWIQTHAVVSYESFLIQKCIQAIESVYAKQAENSIFCEEALGVFGITLDSQVIRLLSDADIIYLAKQIKDDSPYKEYIDEYLNRGIRKKAIWKSESEFDLMLRELGDNDREIFVEWLNDLKSDLSNGTDATETYFTVNRTTKEKIISDNAKKQSDADIPDKDKEYSNKLAQSILNRLNLFETYAEKNGIDFNFVITYNSRFSSNVSKFQQDEILIKYKNFEYPKSIGDVISTYSLNEQSAIKDFSTVYYIYYNRNSKDGISPSDFVKDFVELIKNSND